MLTKNRTEEVIGLCRLLIRAMSYSGCEESAVKEIRRYALASGFGEIHIDDFGSITWRIKGNRPGKRILLDGHIDTVPVPDASKWHFDPFGAEISEGRIYGRGASDMKGAVAAMVCAARFFAADMKGDFPGEIIVAGTVHEECFEGIAAKKILQGITPDLVIIGEASGLHIRRGQRGRAEILLETFGRPAHSANPEKGIHAVYRMHDLIGEIRRLQTPEHPFLGRGILVLTDILSSPYPGASVVPDYCRCTFDRRLLPGEKREDVLKPLQEIIDTARDEHGAIAARVSFASGKEPCYTGAAIEGERFFPAWILPEEDEYVQTTLKAVRAVGIPAEISHYAFCTNGSQYAGEAGIKTIGFGPSAENLAHTVDEYIEIEQLALACSGYIAILSAVLA